MKTDNKENQCPYQIIGKWHLQRGVILYIVTLSDGLELILSSGIAMSVSATQAMKIPCLLPQLAQLIADGMDLPMIEPVARVSPRMLPRVEGAGDAAARTAASDNQPSGGARAASVPTLGSKASDKASTGTCQPLPPPYPRSHGGAGGGRGY